MKQLLIICALFFCNQISAQDCPTDSVAAVEKQEASDERLSQTLFHLSVMLIEPDYEYITDYIYPTSVVAVLGRNRYIVDIRTGEKHLIDENTCYPTKKGRTASAAENEEKDESDDDGWNARK